MTTAEIRTQLLKRHIRNRGWLTAFCERHNLNYPQLHKLMNNPSKHIYHDTALQVIDALAAEDQKNQEAA